MSFLDLLKPEVRAIDASDFDLGDVTWTSVTDSGQRVDAASAIRLPSVWACITLIADAIRSMPVDVYRKTGESRTAVKPPGWLASPNPEQTWGQFVDFAVHSLLTNGNAFVALTGRDNLGFPSELFVLHPDGVQVNRDRRKIITASGVPLTEYNSGNQAGEVLHILGHTADGLIGLSPIDQAKQAIGSGLALEQFANTFFGNGAQVSGVLEMPAGSNPSADQLKGLSDQFKRKFGGKNQWKPLVLANGAAYKPITLPNDQAQFIESRQFSVAEIARLFRVPPHLIGDVERTTSWGSGIEQQGIGFVQYTLLPWLTRLEESFSLLLPRGQFLKFNANALLRGDTKARFEAYSQAIQWGWLTRNEVRALEDIEPKDGLDDPLTPLNMEQA